MGKGFHGIPSLHCISKDKGIPIFPHPPIGRKICQRHISFLQRIPLSYGRAWISYFHLLEEIFHISIVTEHRLQKNASFSPHLGESTVLPNVPLGNFESTISAEELITQMCNRNLQFKAVNPIQGGHLKPLDQALHYRQYF